MARTAGSSSATRTYSVPPPKGLGGMLRSDSTLAPDRGRYIRNEDPWPGSLCTDTKPPLCFTIPYTVASPRPVPSPTALVVKKGSKMCSRVSLSMPVPVSLTIRAAYMPGVTGSIAFPEA